jgi:hypothetical protein
MAGESQLGVSAALTTNSSIAFNIISMTFPEQPITSIPVSTLGTTTFREYNPGKLKDPGQQEFVILHDIDAHADINAIVGTVDTMTITFPLKTGQSVNGTMAGTGYIMDYQVGEYSAEDTDPQQATVVWQWDGKTGPTYTAGS